ncbi:hypothetical protein [Tepidibacter hydrothermalis]|uniref:HTH cro/C1-type domain-containing protein n=1 Tax=Tepidibacter hydrothermalis TaxID=3036126 RepID=A0ABY8EA03_9FIRM|nr:hypothetical protein [Tepidibacter hydrothermalis]WFD08770.1 hypothetical protein P4S50_10205 [Tepidibacter hydrothermalis]
MDFFTSSIIGGVVYDLIKEGVKLSIKNVFGEFYSINLDGNICNEFIEEINSIEGVESKVAYSSNLLNEENRYTVMFEQDMHKTSFAKRLDYIITLMNDRSNFREKINVEKLGKILGFSSVNDLKKYYLFSEEPSYEFIENLAIKLGVNVEWMQFGLGDPFKSMLPSIYIADQILQQEDFMDVQEFIFVIDDEPCIRKLGVIRRFDKFKYDYYPHAFIFRADVGGTGESELFSVYVFLKKLNSMGKMPSGVYKVSDKQFSELFNGKVYPGSIEKYGQDGGTYLLDDFIDLYHSEEEKKKYLNWYGQGFVDCQERIKTKISY